MEVSLIIFGRLELSPCRKSPREILGQIVAIEKFPGEIFCQPRPLEIFSGKFSADYSHWISSWRNFFVGLQSLKNFSEKILVIEVYQKISSIIFPTAAIHQKISQELSRQLQSTKKCPEEFCQKPLPRFYGKPMQFSHKLPNFFFQRMKLVGKIFQ